MLTLFLILFCKLVSINSGIFFCFILISKSYKNCKFYLKLNCNTHTHTHRARLSSMKNVRSYMHFDDEKMLY